VTGRAGSETPGCGTEARTGRKQQERKRCWKEVGGVSREEGRRRGREEGEEDEEFKAERC
jgi:hypothetical protein